MISLLDIATTLQKYRARYRWLDVLASEVVELRRPSETQWKSVSGNTWDTQVNNTVVRLRLSEQEGVARFSIAPLTSEGAAAGATLGALLVGAIAAASSKKENTGEDTVLGLLVGGLAGAAIGGIAASEPTPDENRVLTMRFDSIEREWKVYHGPYVRWAKSALALSKSPDPSSR